MMSMISIRNPYGGFRIIIIGERDGPDDLERCLMIFMSYGTCIGYRVPHADTIIVTTEKISQTVSKHRNSIKGLFGPGSKYKIFEKNPNEFNDDIRTIMRRIETVIGV